MCTISERLFVDYCENMGLTFSKLDDNHEPGRKPDYKVNTNSGPVIVEVKQIELNDEDKVLNSKMQHGQPVSRSKTPGKRILNIINSAKGQLKTHANHRIPCILAIHDTTNWYYLDAMQIEAAMFGELAGKIPPGGDMIWTHGRNRNFAEERKTYISALAVINEGKNQGGPFLEYYHNPFADVKLLLEAFNNEYDIHYEKAHDPSHPYDWIKVRCEGALGALAQESSPQE